LRTLSLTLVCVAWAGIVQAQSTLLTGIATAHIGAATGGDVREKGVTPGLSVAVIESNGLGAEIDLGHARQFNDDVFGESGITSLMVNAIGVWPRWRVQPFIAAGAGLLRVRTSAPGGAVLVNRTDWGFDAGVGAVYALSDALGVRGDVRYFRYFQRHEDLPLLDNGFFDFWRASLGITFSWTLR
jgi:opacity protein-like surface antigen